MILNHASQKQINPSHFGAATKLAMAGLYPSMSPCEGFNATFIKAIIPDLYTEMHTNSALGPIFDAYVPNGIDVTKFGRIATVNFKSDTFIGAVQLNAKVPVMFGRNITINDDLVVKVRVLRSVINYVPFDAYRIGVQFVDLNVKKCPIIKRYQDTSRILTDFQPYTPGSDFRQYLLDSIQGFNNQQYVAEFLDARKEFYEVFKVIGSRF